MATEDPPVIDEAFVRQHLVEAIDSGRQVTINVNDLTNNAYSVSIGPDGVLLVSHCCSAKVSLNEAININAALTAWLAQ